MALSRVSGPRQTGARTLWIQTRQVLQELAAARVERRRRDDLDLDVLIAAADAEARQTPPSAARCARLDRHRQLVALDGRHIDPGAQGRLGHAQRHLEDNVLAFTLEVR